MSPGQPPGVANSALAALQQAAARRRAEREELESLRGIVAQLQAQVAEALAVNAMLREMVNAHVAATGAQP